MENVSSARPTGKFPEKVENLKGRPVFPVGTFRTEFRVPFTHFNSAAILVSRRVTGSAPNRSLRSNATTFHLSENPGCVRLGNPDLDFQNLNPDFPIEREIRKRISPPRNPSSGWISIKKSKSGFHGFPFYRSIEKSETILVNSGLLFAKYACACKSAVLKDSFSNPFSDFFE